MSRTVSWPDTATQAPPGGFVLGVVQSEELQVTVVLTDAQIKLLQTVNVEIIPGIPGKIVLVHEGFFSIDSVAGQYTNISANGSMTTSFTGSVNQLGRVEAAPYVALLGATVARCSFVAFRGLVTGVDVGAYGTAVNSTVIGLGVSVGINNALGNLTGGNAANRLKVTLWYHVVDA